MKTIGWAIFLFYFLLTSSGHHPKYYLMMAIGLAIVYGARCLEKR